MVDQFSPVEYIGDESDYRHWSRESQTYAPADVLMRYLRSGWELDKLAAVESFWHAGVRRVEVYYFTLLNGEERVEMPVLANPAVFRLIEESQLTVIRVNSTQED